MNNSPSAKKPNCYVCRGRARSHNEVNRILLAHRARPGVRCVWRASSLGLPRTGPRPIPRAGVSASREAAGPPGRRRRRGSRGVSLPSWPGNRRGVSGSRACRRCSKDMSGYRPRAGIPHRRWPAPGIPSRRTAWPPARPSIPAVCSLMPTTYRQSRSRASWSWARRILGSPPPNPSSTIICSQ